MGDYVKSTQCACTGMILCVGNFIFVQGSSWTKQWTLLSDDDAAAEAPRGGGSKTGAHYRWRCIQVPLVQKVLVIHCFLFCVSILVSQVGHDSAQW